MNNKLVAIFTAINTLHELKIEKENVFFLLKPKIQKEINKNKNIIKNKIETLIDDEWTLKYIIDLEETLIAYYPNLHESENDSVCIPSYNPYKLIQSFFYPIYFTHNENGKNRLIILDIITDNISFTIVDPSTGEHFEVSSQYTVQYSQKKIELICKRILIDFIIDYLNKNS